MGAVTERKPAGMSFRSWIDQQIEEAQQRGAFDDLPGAGKPLPDRGDEDAGQAWLREYVRREGVSAEEMLPTPLRLRKESERLAGNLTALCTEQQVREAVGELNERILAWRRLPLDSPIFVRLVDEEAMVDAWRRTRPAPVQQDAVPADGAPEPGREAGPRPGRRRRWWQRVRTPRAGR